MCEYIHEAAAVADAVNFLNCLLPFTHLIVLLLLCEKLHSFHFIINDFPTFVDERESFAKPELRVLQGKKESLKVSFCISIKMKSFPFFITIKFQHFSFARMFLIALSLA